MFIGTQTFRVPTRPGPQLRLSTYICVQQQIILKGPRGGEENMGAIKKKRKKIQRTCFRMFLQIFLTVFFLCEHVHEQDALFMNWTN